jgi:hypothetical protein
VNFCDVGLTRIVSGIPAKIAAKLIIGVLDPLAMYK